MNFDNNFGKCPVCGQGGIDSNFNKGFSYLDLLNKNKTNEDDEEFYEDRYCSKCGERIYHYTLLNGDYVCFSSQLAEGLLKLRCKSGVKIQYISQFILGKINKRECFNRGINCSINGISDPLIVCQLERMINSSGNWERIVIDWDDFDSYGSGNLMQFKEFMDALKSIIKNKPLIIENLHLKWWKLNEPDLAIILSEFNLQEITIPALSASDVVLERMQIGYSINDFNNFIKSIRKLSGKVHIATYIISGFPFENIEDHHKNLAFVRNGLCDSIKIFSYSPRPNVLTNCLKNKMDELEKTRRYKELNKEVNKCSNLQRIRVRKFFSEIAKHYNQNYSSTGSFLERMAIVKSFLDGSSFDLCIDIGCGTGDYVSFFEKISKKVFAVDISPEMIAQAKINNKRSKAVFLNGDIAYLKFEDMKFDVIVAIGLLEYYENHDILLSTIKKLSKNGTMLILSFPNIYSVKRMIDRILNRPFEMLGRKTGLRIRKSIVNRKTMSYTKYGYIKHKEFSVPMISRALIKNGFTPIAFEGYNKRSNKNGLIKSSGIIVKAYAN